jgi:hypothetical protein
MRQSGRFEKVGDEKYQTVSLKYPWPFEKRYSWDFSPQPHQNGKITARRIRPCFAKN